MKAQEIWVFDNVQLYRVVDGDTLYLSINEDIGFGFTASTRPEIRIDGVDTPETHGKTLAERQAAAAAKAYVEEWFRTANGPIRLETRKNPDKYGRWLGRISSGDHVLNEDLVSSGHAVAYDGGTKAAFQPVVGGSV